MDSAEVRHQKQRIDKFKWLEELVGNISETLMTLQQMSGNASEVCHVTQIVISRDKKPDLVLPGAGVAGFKIRQALEPIYKELQDQVYKEMDKV